MVWGNMVPAPPRQMEILPRLEGGLGQMFGAGDGEPAPLHRDSLHCQGELMTGTHLIQQGEGL